ncbi:MAG: DUF349 domain-containing protein, partial [Lentisphaeraceae bacterium]|nr:DUF349 domain-containing protein [Lentisphaeraceae bacterium]
AAVDKVSDKETLQKLMKAVRHKGTRLLVRKRYDLLFGEEEKAIARKNEGQAKLEKILKVLEGMSTLSNWSSLNEDYATQLDRWQQLSEFSTEEHNQKFHDICEKCQVRKSEYEKIAAEKAAQAAVIEARLQKRRLVLNELLAATETLQENGSQLLADFKGRWQVLASAESDEEVACQNRFEKALQTFDVKQDLLRDLQQKKEAKGEELQAILTELNKLKESDATSRLSSAMQQQRKKLNSFDEYFKKEFSAIFTDCQSALTELDAKLVQFAAEAEKRAVELNKEYEALIAAVGAFEKSSRANTDKIKEMQATWKGMANLDVKVQGKFNTRFRKSCDLYFDKLKEDAEERDWTEFSNLSVKERLIAETEALEAIEDPQELAKRIKEKQSTWKEIGPVPYAKSDEIWERFKTVSDKLYLRCKAYYDEQDGKRQKCLEVKLLICEGAEALQTSQDWKVAGEKLKELQKQWKEAGNGPRKEDQLAWQRFRAACDVFFAARKSYYAEQDEARAENTKRKQALVEEIEKWSVSEKLREAAQRIKELQTEWKNIGPASRDQDQKLWQQFRKAADDFFGKRKEQYNKTQESLAENATGKEALCTLLKEKLDALNEDSDWTALSQFFRQSQKDWRLLPGAGTDRDQELWKEFRALCDSFFEARDAFYDKLSAEDKVKVDAKEEYCLKVELLVESSEWRETADELKKLQAEFKELPSVNEKYDRLLYKRFNGVCQSFFDRRRDHFDEQDGTRQENLKSKKSLCARLEELAGVEYQGDDEVEEISMDDLASQLQSAFENNFGGEAAKPLSFKDAGQEVRELQAAWKTIGPVPKAQSQTVWERFRKAADTFYDKRQVFFAGRNADEGKNLQQKEVILGKLQAQLDAPDFKAVKILQKQWRDCGDVPRDKGRELHQKFRTLCDQIYGSSNEQVEQSQGEMRI